MNMQRRFGIPERWAHTITSTCTSTDKILDDGRHVREYYYYQPSKKDIMARQYMIKCPKCGKVFKVLKGVLTSWDFTKNTPEELLEETPFHCPNCSHKMSVQDEDFRDNVREVLCVD